MSGLNDGFRFFGKSEITLPRTRQNIDFSKKIQKSYFFQFFLYDLEENIPNRQFLIFDFSWILRIFLLSPRISELLKQALKWRIICYPCSFLSIIARSALSVLDRQIRDVRSFVRSFVRPWDNWFLRLVIRGVDSAKYTWCFETRIFTDLKKTFKNEL